MGNSSTKESRTSTGSDPRPGNVRHAIHSSISDPSSSSLQAAGSRLHPLSQGSRGVRRHDVSFFGLGAISDGSASEPRRETKQERDARRAERERTARAKERERSLKEESVDGGYVVTLGTYIGTEDFSKSTVRQLMLERRIAPFWRGLNEHSESWTEHQLVAAARGKAIPAPDEIPPEEMPPTTPGAISSSKPIAVRNQASSFNPSDYASTFFSSHLSANQTYTGSGNSAPQSSSPLFRGRSKTLASLSSKDDSQTELTPPEINLPHQPQINGQPVEAYLYKDVLECPICFLCYPPYLNRTRCCDQPICSECFVQIKRPDPHPPEHLDPNSPPSPEARRQEEEGVLISEPASCPFCVQAEFGVTYEPPPFRRGLAYPNQAQTSAQLLPPRSSPSKGPGFTRRRGQSVSASDSTVISTDRVRPDWAKKLADARSQAARRSAAATALHTAAYMMGGNNSDPRLVFGRRRGYLISADAAGSSEDGIPRTSGAPIPNMELLMTALEGQSSSRGRRMTAVELPPSRFSSRGSRTDELEELMLMEAIRQSLAAEEERKKKEDKEATKEAQKEEKKKAKEQKKADKVAKKQPIYSSSSANASSVLAGSSSPPAASGTSTDEGNGKGKASNISETAPSITTLGFNPLNEPTSTVNMGIDKLAGQSTSSDTNPQRHLEQSRANLGNVEAFQSTDSQSTSLPNHRSRLRGLSDASSSSSSFAESPPGSVRNELTGSISSYNPTPNASGHHLPFGSHSQQDTPTPPASSSVAGTETVLNFGSLAAMVGNEEGKGDDSLERGDRVAPADAASAAKADDSASLPA